jgi:hypothetical protein
VAKAFLSTNLIRRASRRMCNVCPPGGAFSASRRARATRMEPLHHLCVRRGAREQVLSGSLWLTCSGVSGADSSAVGRGWPSVPDVRWRWTRPRRRECRGSTGEHQTILCMSMNGSIQTQSSRHSKATASAAGEHRWRPAPLVHYISMRMEDRSGAKEGTPELYFTDPDGLLIQLQDAKYCGGAGVLGDVCGA